MDGEQKRPLRPPGGLKDSTCETSQILAVCSGSRVQPEPKTMAVLENPSLLYVVGRTD